MLYHYRTRAGQITTAGFPPRKTDDLRMYWEWLQYFSARPGARGILRLGRGAVLADLLPVLVPERCSWQPAGAEVEIHGAQKHLDAILPDILSSSHLPLGEKAAGGGVLCQPHADLRRRSGMGPSAQEEGK